MNRDDADRLGLRDADRVVLRSQAGEFRGRVRIAPMKPGNLEVHWPEGNVLMDRRRRSPEAGIPDYNAIVRLERVDAPREPARA
jgi:anaerobic selenocysteine-containing dehydrogenase